MLKNGTSYLFKKQLFLTNVGISFGLSGNVIEKHANVILAYYFRVQG
jgi:hypothetical protein